MSIYCTLGYIWLEDEEDFAEPGPEILFQGVPGHIGHPSCYPEGDPYGDFLPPPVADTNDLRAVVVLDRRWQRKDIQRYVSPLFVLTGEEWNTIPWPDLWQRIEDRVRDFEAYGPTEPPR